MEAPPWPSERMKRNQGSSDRHAAMARMRDRRERHQFSPEPDEGVYPTPPSRPAPQRRRPEAGAHLEPRSEVGAASCAPWAPPWSPDAPKAGAPGARRGELPPDDKLSRPRRRELAADDELPAYPRSARNGDRDRERDRERDRDRDRDREREHECDRDREFQRSSRHDHTVDEATRSSRVRGPAEARTNRGKDQAQDDEPLPPSVAKAVAKGDFQTLQQIISKSIQEAEVAESSFEASLKKAPDDDGAEARVRQDATKRREEELAARQRERAAAREQRRLEDEERRRKQAEELERDEQQEQQKQKIQEETEAQCRREFVAATRLQAHVRGRLSRKGQHCTSPAAIGKIHKTPLSAMSTAAPSKCSTPTLLC